MRRGTFPLLAALLLILCLAVNPASAADWVPPHDRSVVGVEWNASDPSPALRWIDGDGNTITPPDFNTHVVWGNVKKVLLTDDEVVIRDTNPRGDTLDMSGASGKVMTEIPAFYVMSENASTGSFRYYRWFISPDPAAGFTLHPAFVQRGGTERDNIYVGSYEATLRVLDDGTLALDSRSGEQPWTGYYNNPLDGMFKLAFDAGTAAPAIGATVTGSTSGTAGQVVDLYVSSGSWASSDAAGFLILKQTSGTFTNGEPLKVSAAQFATANTGAGNAGIVATINTFETAGEALGPGYGAMNVWTYSAIRMLHLVEYASWGSQETVGLGIVSKASGTGFAGEITGYNSVDTNVNEYGTGTGTGSAGFTPASYRTATDLWGNSWEWVTGYTSTDTEYRIVKRDGTGSLSTHPLAAGSYESSEATPLGADGRVYGYWTSLFHEDLLQYQFLANSVTGGSQSTYGTDYQYSHNPGTRVLLAGGYWHAGRGAGLGYLKSSNAASYSDRAFGARLEFTGAATLNGAAPAAQYTQNATAGNAPLAIAFTDASTGTPGWWRWDFGDGTSSTEQNPAHTYTEPGTYTVTQTAYTLYGENTTTQTVEVRAPPVATFTQNATEGNAPLAVAFTDASTGNVTAWSWSFGDGETSTDRNATHTYTEPGTYSVTLNASNAYGYNISAATAISVLAPPVADFSTNTTEGNAPLAVAFTDTSTGNVTAWGWTFGDGNTSTAQSPTHTYTKPGTYTVTLNASNAYGYNISAATAISVLAPPVADFSTNTTEGNAPLAVAFTDTSTGNVTAWGWTFGDGNTSTDQNPSHTYAAAGTYTVTLNASNAYGYNISAATAISVLAPPVADFIANATVIPTGSAVAFTDASTGNVTAWSWDFGDSQTSTDRNATHTYAAAGLYSVTLNASNAYGYNISTRTDYIDVGNPPAAGFTTNVTGGNAPLAVQFTDATENTPTSWAWTFGDGNTSTLQNPAHTYAAPGTYTVTLNASNAYGFNISTQTDLITVLTPPSAAFIANATVIPVGGTVLFTDLSSGNITTWEWTFGDGNTSTAQSPAHTYAAAGTYTVTLNASNAYGFNISTWAAYIDVGPVPVATFSANVTGGNTPLAVQFTDTSTGAPTSWAWTFGDGNTSTLQNPAHTYATKGTYTVTLTASNAYGEDTETKTELVTALTPATASFTTNVTGGNAPQTVQFTDTSTGDVTAWSWTFGDGNTSTDQNPSHTYASPGLYTVTLNASNPYNYDLSTQTDLITILTLPAANFSANPTLIPVGGTIQFTDASTGNITGWAWTFGDGETSTDQSPSHTYTAAGLQTVSLTVSNPYGEDTETKTGYIDVGYPPAANFTPSATLGVVPAAITFTDTSDHTPTAWLWDFGDGNTSTLQNPSHTYVTAGTYTVTLNASNAYGEDTETKTDLLTLYDPVTANFTADTTAGLVQLAVQFSDTSTGDLTAWAWTFGDGATSTQQNPSHTYTAEGNYTVTLTASNPADEDSETKTEYIKVFDPVTAAFTVDETLGLTPLTVQFTSTGTGTPAAWAWDFGDGAASSEQNPAHTYTKPGTYTVTLTVADGIIGENPPLTTDTETQTGLIAAYDPLVPGFSASATYGYIPFTVQFTDTSAGAPTAWAWTFGDGTTSTEQNPSHTYTVLGTYPVTLTVSHAADEQTETKADYIIADYRFTAAFTLNATSGVVPMAVAFTDTTPGTPVSRLWDFGDGTTSTEKNPVHVYPLPGYYDVSLTVYGIQTQNTRVADRIVHAGILPTVAFSGTPTTGTAPLTVAFTATCQDTTSYRWTFGDGATSTQQNPSHTYATPGTYTVTLTGTNLYGSTVTTRTDYITATHVPPVAAFSASPTAGSAPVPVKFTDASTGTPTAWAWTFGDGTTSTLRNPTHIYRAAGTYSVTLTVTNPGGSDAETKTDLITIYAAGDPGHTTRYPASDLVVTMDATGLGTQKATLNGELAAATTTEVWFEYGSKSNSYGFRTAAVTAEPGSLISTDLKNFPLIAGQTYYYRAACADGYGAEKSFTLTSLSAHPTTTYGDAADQFLYSFEDGDTMIQDMTEATWSPYVANLGALFFGLVIGAIFLNLAMKGHSIGIPVVLTLVIGGSLWAFVPPEFVILAQAFIIMGIGGLMYYIYTKRKL